MAIRARPSESDFRRFLLEGGTIRFVVEAADIDPEGTILRDVPADALLYGFQLARMPPRRTTERWLSNAIKSEHWSTIEEIVLRRAGSITYRQVARGLFEATCFIAMGQTDEERLTRSVLNVGPPIRRRSTDSGR
ncbi:hypothetical protein ISP15_09810 [Dyella jejuensis]|uniref:Uncharacterized protein n=1 Tax=Dyella jejuensis TaxID=1432009 RepID=A0ABW8JHP4_9GAMM